jgi:mRNA interferase MazF
MKRGIVVWVDLSDTDPPEMNKTRPGIVVSSEAHNQVLNTVVVVPISTQAPQILPLRLDVGEFQGRRSFAVIPGIRQVRKSRLHSSLGQLSFEQLRELDGCLAAYLS